MKNYLKYFYGMNADNLVFFNNKYIFCFDNDIYILKYLNNLEFSAYYNRLSYELSKFGSFSNFVLNKEKQLITVIEGKAYVLLKLKKEINIDDKLDINDIKIDMFIESSDDLIKFRRFPWTIFWENKIDYFEKWILDKKDLYKEFYPLFNYFIGLSENALFYLKDTLINETQYQIDRLTVQHFRISYQTFKYEYFDPSNVIFDHSSRDISEYIKSLWENEILDYEMLEVFLDKFNLSRFWIRVMYSRLLFPSFFFDYIEMNAIKNSNIDLSYLENKMSSFQVFLNKISLLLSKKYKIECLKWIVKNN